MALSERDRAILDFERTWWTEPGPKDAAIRTRFGVSPTRYYRLLKAFEELTGCGVLVNTSFNVRGEPIVCSPEDAYRCFMRTEIDVLVLGNHLVYKADQKPLEADMDWRKEFVLD